MALILPVEDKSPQWGEDCFIAPNATIVGDVIMGDQCSVWFNAVVRGDVNSIRMGKKVNVQDGAVIHATYQKTKAIIGNNVSIGGLLILALLRYNDWRFVAPLCLIFYGLALVNGSKYTLSEIRYLGLCEIVLGLINTQFIGYGLYFWAVGFGVLHIIYGFIMWWKNERQPSSDMVIANK